ncbi:FAD-binding oxidoreductase [Shewanella corallii]|uniref:FAD-binding oxidoreductase n=1 Tax=Shewanella corallii TaxID=560080 RepID=A0ABT0N3D5_9GAMM|nr:FAD-dependent oxidoreductase [Shewanella corallii]MCL2912376.1 FAD-binding oxidoreductase [Shewanella corallii]
MQNQQHSNQTPHIVVLGAGVVGLCTAIQLQLRGATVTLVDKDGVGEGCSKGNAGHFATEQVFPLAQASLLPQLPGMLLDPKGALRISPTYLLRAIRWFLQFMANMRRRVFKRNTASLRALNEGAMDAWQRLLDKSQSQHLLHCKGSLLTFESDSREAAKATQAMYHSEGVGVELLERQALDALQPGLHPNITHALHFTQVGHTSSPYQLSQSLFLYAKSLGVKLLQAEISQIKHAKGKLTLSTDSSVLNTDKLVVCTGAFSKTLCNQLGYQVPLDTERGYHYMVSSERMPTMPVVSFEKKFILTPMSEGLRLAGTVEFAGIKQAPNYQRADMLKQLGESIWPDIQDDKPEDEKRWMGFRPTLPDSLPVMGKAPRHDNLFFNFGHQHLGLTLAAVSAELVAAEVMGEKPAVNMTSYSIARFN